MTKKKNPGLARWQASNPNQSWAQISFELLDCAAWNALTQKQQNLYLYILRLRYAAQKAALRHNDSPITPTTRWPDYDNVTEDTIYLTFKKAVQDKKYKDWDDKTFYTDRKVLVILGFLELVIDGKTISYKEASVYKMSARWQKITEKEIKAYKAANVIGSKPISKDQDKIIESLAKKQK